MAELKRFSGRNLSLLWLILFHLNEMALVCRTAETTYVWQLLSEMGAIQMEEIAVHLIPPISSPPIKFSVSSFLEIL